MRHRVSAMRRNYMILAVFEVWRRHSLEVSGLQIQTKLTMRDVAFWLKMTPSTYLKRKLDGCVAAGWLERSEEPYRANANRHLYSLTDAGHQMISDLTPKQAQLL